MTIFVDASAMIAMMVGEADAAELADRLEAGLPGLYSAMSVWETVAGLCKKHTFSVTSARSATRSFLSDQGFRFVAIGEREYEIAADAYAQFGKGRHPAAMNMGDCFAYACAKANRVGLLFKGNDFHKTDIATGGVAPPV